MKKKTWLLYIILAILFALTFVKGCEYSYGTDNGAPRFESFYSSVPIGGLGAYQIGGAVMLLALVIGLCSLRRRPFVPAILLLLSSAWSIAHTLCFGIRNTGIHVLGLVIVIGELFVGACLLLIALREKKPAK